MNCGLPTACDISENWAWMPKEGCGWEQPGASGELLLRAGAGPRERAGTGCAACSERASQAWAS